MVMEILDSFEFTKRSSSGTSKYPWSDMLDGQIRKLVRNKDYACKDNTMMMLIRKAAKARNLKVLINKVDGGLVIRAIHPHKASSNGTEGKESDAPPRKDSETPAVTQSEQPKQQAEQPKKHRRS
jgi:hypothetical protein